jgi:hypothetical protein
MGGPAKVPDRFIHPRIICEGEIAVAHELIGPSPEDGVATTRWL